MVRFKKSEYRKLTIPQLLSRKTNRLARMEMLRQEIDNIDELIREKEGD